VWFGGGFAATNPHQKNFINGHSESSPKIFGHNEEMLSEAKSRHCGDIWE